MAVARPTPAEAPVMATTGLFIENLRGGFYCWDEERRPRRRPRIKHPIATP
jgi:hypothetical protein